MIPSIRHTSPVQQHYLAFIEALKACGFEGDMNPDYANRTVLATDNSIYQVLPQGVIYPKSIDDLIRLVELVSMKQFHDIVLSPRGGGTGTNGQSLTDGLVVDLSKHMNRILEINAEEGWAIVEAGVVKDQLNAAVKPFGLFFAPELSTSNRATLGGMINTDASGQGSCVYGKTRDHILELTTVLLDGTEWTSKPLSDEELNDVSQQPSRIGGIHRTLAAIEQDHKDAIENTFPKLNRCLTGYDLAHIRDDQGRFNLNNILCGSEGTLGFIATAKVNLLRIPKYTALVNLNYDSFDAALRDATELMKAGPTSIETVDSKVMALAQSDIIWNTVGQFFPDDPTRALEAINLVEYCGDDQGELEAQIAQLIESLTSAREKNEARSYSQTVAWGKDVQTIWAMRKKAVGLLGNAKGEARPIPFVEDTAVPPEHLANYIAEFRALLDSHKLSYGMFGHVDAGVLHVRPAIDMKDPNQETLIRSITDEVVQLTAKYGGLVWGEHGKGVRSEYATTFFGDLYPQLQRIKAHFDPRNQLNPGKIATPGGDIPLLKIDEVSTRGQQDRKIPVHVWEGYKEGMYCNGNGACHNYNPNDAMCPSWKGTRQRIHTPKGRASLIREWLKQLSERGVDPIEQSEKQQRGYFLKTLPRRIKNTLEKRRGQYDFNHEVHEAMMGCLACKSCVGQCPIKVDVPEFRSKFLELYYGRYLRPLKDYFVGSLEFLMPHLVKAPWLYNGLMKPKWTQKLLARYTGLTDSPLLTGMVLEESLDDLGVLYAVPENIHKLTPEQKQKAVILVQDAFTSYFETQLVLDTLTLLKKLGFTPLIAPYVPNGKPLHVHGFLKAFRKVANNTVNMLSELATTGVPLVGLEPSMTLAYRSEYTKALPDRAIPQVSLLQEWLATHSSHLTQQSSRLSPGHFKLLGHCTEKTNAAPAMKHWKSIFEDLGQTFEEIAVGCCGMAGTYGHETQNQDTSKAIYELSWKGVIDDEHGQALMASGYSCRSQVKRFSDVQLPHPTQVLLQQLQQGEKIRKDTNDDEKN
ncbi:FAD-binding and (Fe-S)-binding domain-containing protein [Marinibactrum halimedae]|uniref:D-2-hydroxyglutarate dehydrogenase n=1 Tax=Marinibactrum halimedae TaxID=1444977 RepID=A0AA37T4P8_9GAMM|nr:FAD-binding and (Fe-S)-binding domain-containing protein [Marinibactrum halimedae]MCD9459663.1 FAD-binding oxidoreductase [Marinibactrum halimedae]GLS25689.1 FAD-linked oxidase [Marinibactrum halimedae]